MVMRRCQTCSIEFNHTRPGKPPNNCPEHRGSNRTSVARDAARASARGDLVALAAFTGEAVGPGSKRTLGGGLTDTALALLLGGAMPQAHGDAHRAAELAGVSYRDDEHLAQLVALGADLNAADPDASSERLSGAITMLTNRLVVDASRVPPSMLAASLKSAVAAEQILNGGMRKIPYANVSFVVEGPNGVRRQIGNQAEETLVNVTDQGNTVAIRWRGGGEQIVRNPRVQGSLQVTAGAKS